MPVLSRTCWTSASTAPIPNNFACRTSRLATCRPSSKLPPQSIECWIHLGVDVRLAFRDFVFEESNMSKGLIVVIILALIALVAFGQYIGVRNTLVTKNEAVKASWSQVDIALQRRADLIPNLVETVKGYATQEQTVFGDIAKARSQLLGA